MKEKYIYFWRLSFEHSKKLEFNKVFKDDYSTSDYLHQLRNYNERRNLVKFKISNHKLMIELGRCQSDHIPRPGKADYAHCASQIKWKMNLISCFNVADTLFRGRLS